MFAVLSLPMATGLARFVLSKNGWVHTEPQATYWAWMFNLGAALIPRGGKPDHRRLLGCQ